MTLWEKAHRSRVWLKRSARLFSVVLGIGGLSAVTLSGDNALSGGTRAQIAGHSPDADNADRARSTSELARVGPASVRPLSFSKIRPVTLNDGAGEVPRSGHDQADEGHVFVSGSLQGDPSRIHTGGRKLRLNF